MKYIEDIDLENKKVILRLDLNVTIRDGIIIDETKIKKSIPTIKYLLKKNAKVLIMSHLGKVESEEDKVNYSLRIVSDTLSKLLDIPIKFINNTRSKELENCLDEHNLCMMENTRFEDVPNKLESNCDLELASYWASLGSVFINDAFGTTHRKHASNYGISKYIESGYGFLINEEICGLDPIIKNVKTPFTVIMGGAKVDDKVALIESLLQECDHLLVGGGIANTFLKAKNYNIGTSLYSIDYIEKIKELIDKYYEKILMPIDVVVEENKEVKSYEVNNIPTDACIYDIGPKTIEVYKGVIKESKTIFVNGTMGLYEKEEYRTGTENLYNIMNETEATIIAGGGDAVASINKLGYTEIFDFLSTGGGATLEYIADKKIKCFEE